MKFDESPRGVAAPAKPDGIAPAATTGIAPASAHISSARDSGIKDAKYYRERGILAYRSGDLYIALANFDLAIDLDPGLADSYINRGIVFRRLGDLKRAFSDVAEAKRIENLDRNKTPSVARAP
jgi:tetratricopeptide (TPR) repeat protein